MADWVLSCSESMQKQSILSHDVVGVFTMRPACCSLGSTQILLFYDTSYPSVGDFFSIDASLDWPVLDTTPCERNRDQHCSLH